MLPRIRHGGPRAARPLFFVLLLLLLLPAVAGASELTVHARVAHLWREYQVNADLTYTEIITVDTEVVTTHLPDDGVSLTWLSLR